MKAKTIIKISGVVILATAASFVFLFYKVGEEMAMVRCGSGNSITLAGSEDKQCLGLEKRKRKQQK